MSINLAQSHGTYSYIRPGLIEVARKERRHQLLRLVVTHNLIPFQLILEQLERTSIPMSRCK